MQIEPIRPSVTVSIAPQAAFDRFTGSMQKWWPCKADIGWPGVLSSFPEMVAAHLNSEVEHG